jgi:hypothetical protein
VIEDKEGGLRYCAKHYEAVLELRDWLIVWMRDRPLDKKSEDK